MKGSEKSRQSLLDVNMRDIGKNIRDLREHKNFTQEELASRLYVTRQTVSNYENGKSRPDVDMILKIADVLNVDVNTVFYGMPETENKRYAYRCMMIASAILFVMIIAVIILHPLSDTLLTRRYQGALMLLVNLLLDPAVLLVAGWWIMHGIYMIWQPKPLNKPWTRKVKWCLLIFLLVCFGLILPYVTFYVVADVKGMVTSRVDARFPNIPVYSAIFKLILQINMKYVVVYAILGGLLRILGFPVYQNDKRH